MQKTPEVLSAEMFKEAGYQAPSASVINFLSLFNGRVRIEESLK